MAVVSTFSSRFLLDMLRGEHDVEDDTLTICLMNTTFAFNPDTHEVYADISANEIATGAGYTQKGKNLSNVALSYNTTSNYVQIDCDDVTWTATGSGIPAVGAACIINNTHASESVILCIDFGADYTTASGTQFQINFTNGMAKATIV